VPFFLTFPSGWGASIISGPHSYGGKRGLWELLELDPRGDAHHPEGQTSDVRGWLNYYKVGWFVAAIAQRGGKYTRRWATHRLLGRLRETAETVRWEVSQAFVALRKEWPRKESAK
jgi:hypothetical protein